MSERPFETTDIWTMTGQASAVETLEERAESVRRNLDPGVAEILVRDAVKADLSAVTTASGISLARPDAEQTLREAHARRHDEDAARQAAQLDLDITASIAALEARVEGAMQPPVEANADRRDLRTLVLFRLYEGQTLADVANDYARTSDTDDPTFVALVETRAGDLARLFKLRPTDSDVAALQRLQDTMAARRAQRADPKAAAQLERLRGLRTMTLRNAVQEARRGTLKVARLTRSHGT